MFSHRSKLILSMSTLLLAGCGQYGPLYLPHDNSPHDKARTHYLMKRYNPPEKTTSQQSDQ